MVADVGADAALQKHEANNATRATAPAPLRLAHWRPMGGTAVGNDDAPATACADAETKTQTCAARARANGARRNGRNPDGTLAQSPTTQP